MSKLSEIEARHDADGDEIHRTFEPPEILLARHADRAWLIAALKRERAGVPDGWVLVPREATLDMSIAFAEAFYRERRCIDDHDISEWWSAMLDAALEPGDAP